nr:chondroitin sulfate proteoglycan 4 isoform X2 [Oryctolagus cuniculus]
MGRPGARRLALLTACLGLCAARAVLGASFYGESYVELNILESSSELSLQFKFQTSKPQGLLFLAAGKSDYCILELLSGTLRVRVNLGTGEQVLLSEQRLHMDDLVWHFVELYCVKDNISLIIDKHYKTTEQIAGGMPRLSFQHGIYIGGHGGLNVPYIDGEFPNFRGCMEDVIFNQREILKSLRSYPGFKKVYEVSLGCSDEFFAGQDEAINFFSSRSYVTFTEWKVQRKGLLEFALQSGTQQALLLFQSGREGDFVALEIHEGLLKAHVGRGTSKAQLSSSCVVNDNKWHVIQLKFMGRYLDLIVDKQGERTLLPLQSKPFVSEGPLFLGGLDNRMREEAKRLELASVPRKSARGISFKGCLRGLEVNSEKRALRDALVSKDISAGCKSSINPSLTTVENLLQSEVSCSTGIPETIKPSLQDEISHFLVLSNLEVQEGGRALLEQKHIRLNVEFEDLGLHHSQVLFKIEEMPTHGFFQLDVSPEKNVEKAFTLLDLWQGKVWYVHDGSEESTDHFTFSISSKSKKEMPLYLQDHAAHVFHITVLPVNDPPYLKLPEGNLLLLFENSRKRVTPDVIHVSDPDTDSLSLSFSVLGNFNSDAGFLENARDRGKAISGFTQKDLRDGNVFYVHRGHRNSRIVLRASDGELVSNTVVLRVMAVPWDFEVANRTGVVVQQGGTVLITRSNLSVVVNGQLPEMQTRYEITRPPQFGQVQRQGSNGEWKQVSTFSQHAIDRSRVRYWSTVKELQLENVTDYFKFKVNVEGKVNEEHLMFPVTIQWLKFMLLKNVPLEITQKNKQVLNSDHLRATTEGVEVAEEGLHFKLLTPPTKGKLLLGNKVLKTNSIFSQRDITDAKISYEPQERPKEDSQDNFRFLIIAKHIESKDYTFRINFKADKVHIILTNKELLVKEGEGKVITKSELFVQTLDNQIFQYKITKSPQHGKLKLISFTDSLENSDNVTAFTDQDIVGERLMYVHDDSETQYDEFFIVASTKGPDQEEVVRDLDLEPLSTEIQVTISVELKNDEKPVRVVDKVFHVVRNGQRLLTQEDLCYHDPDLDFDDRQLLYTRRGIPNGDLVQASDPTQKLYKFRQEDLWEGHVLFKHWGADSARFVLFVTDGVHYTSSLLEVSASDPYVQVANNTGLLVQRGQEGSVTTANLSVTTNQDVRTDHEIKFHIVQPPKHGRVLVNKTVSHSFSQHDLKQGYVIYRHDGSGDFDVFNLTVKVKDVYLEVEVYVQVCLDGYQHHTHILQRKTLVVEEGKPVKLSRGKFQAGNEDNFPSEAMFIVRTPPMHGFLQKSIAQEGSLNTEERSPLVFTQQDVNAGHILYIQTVPGQQQDRFSLDVMTGSQVVSAVEILVDIVPKWIPLEVRNFTVQEGGSKALLQDHLKIPSQYFEGLDCEFVLLEPPKHGYIESSDLPRIKLMKFTRKQVENELIYYVHDDSEELLDNFTIFVNSSELGKQSLPQTLYVTVESINDEAPVITANKILQVNEGQIFYQHVDCEDAAWTVQDSFTFTVSSPPAALGPEEFRVTISYEINEPGRQSQLLANTGAAVKEGGRVLIDQSKLDASNLLFKLSKSQRSSYEIWFQVTSLPHHGTIAVGERNITKEKPNFSQYIVNKFGITYLHDDSESLADNFTFAAWPNRKNESPIKPEADFLEELFTITISPVNDQAPALKTKGLQLRVLQGSTLVVGPENLKVEDLDNSPDEIRYTVIRHPSNGFLAMANHVDSPIHHFTQADIDHSQVWFIHDGSPSSGVFYFSVTDGEHRPLYKLFHLDVIPISITLVNLTDLLLPQGQTSVLLTSAHLSAVTNGRSPQITYRITWPLRHGHLLIGDQVVTSFGQEDLNSRKLSYHMTNLTASEDQLQFSVFTSESNLTGQTLGIRVLPLLRVTSHLTVANGVAHQLRRKDLDATELANMTNSDPTFEVTEPPVHGRLVRRVVRSSVTEDATLFTQSDIDQGLLVLDPHANLTGVPVLNDSFTFLLRADHVQPAIGYLSFTIVPPDSLILQTFTPNVPLLVTGGSLVTSVLAQENPVISSGPMAQTDSLEKPSQTSWQKTEPWGQHSDEELHVYGKASPTRVVWPPAATRVSHRAPTQPRASNYPLMVIVALAVVVFLLTVTAVALCVWLLGRKTEKAKPLIKPQTNVEPPTPCHRPERSTTVPTVTVTPLIKSSSSPPASLFRVPHCEKMVSSLPEPVEKCAPWETWLNLDPDMVKLCRQTNPTLKHKQYWV